GQPGVLYDAVYSEAFRQTLFDALAKRRKFRTEAGELVFNADRLMGKEAKELVEVRSKVLSAEQSNTSIIFADRFFLKLYRKIDDALNPDVEITRFLTERAKFAHTPRYLGAIEWQRGESSFVMGMMQELVRNQGDAWEYFKSPLGRYFERVEALPEDERKPPKVVGTLTAPATFEQTPEVMQEIIGGAYVERLELLGRRTAGMHLALAGHRKVEGFEPEEFSLHYQRSLYSSLQAMVKNNFGTLKAHLKSVPEAARAEAEGVLALRPAVIDVMKQIYDHKIETLKIRNHGDYHLGQVLFTGKDFVIIDFEGEPARSFSERRLRRSALRDVAGMLRSFHYAAYSALFAKNGEDSDELAPWAEQWYHYAGGFFMGSYLEELGSDTTLIPQDRNDFGLLLRVFLLEKAVYELGYELNNRPTWVGIPLRGISTLMQGLSD
ncbi:MAG: putative maltokinase, partial [Catalinimonas sp.]